MLCKVLSLPFGPILHHPTTIQCRLPRHQIALGSHPVPLAASRVISQLASINFILIKIYPPLCYRKAAVAAAAAAVAPAVDDNRSSF